MIGVLNTTAKIFTFYVAAEGEPVKYVFKTEGKPVKVEKEHLEKLREYPLFAKCEESGALVVKTKEAKKAPKPKESK